jgi:hypothetical protein
MPICQEQIDVRRSIAREPIVPAHIRHDLDFDRFHNRDIARLTAAEAWAERELLRSTLARRVFHRRRERIIGFDSDYRPISDQAWLRCRIAALSRKLDGAAA